MGNRSKKTTQVGLRLPNKELGMVDAFALKNDLNRSQALLSLLRLGLKRSDELPATRRDQELVSVKLEAMSSQQQAAVALLVESIKNQPIAAIQQNVPAQPEPGRKLSLRERITGRAE